MIPKCTILDVAAVLDPPLAFIEIYESLIRSFKSLARGKDFYAKKTIVLYLESNSARTNNVTILLPVIFSCYIYSINFCWRMVDNRRIVLVKIFPFLYIYLYSALNQLLIYKLCYSVNSNFQRNLHPKLM